MANKRDIKKIVRATCGMLALETVNAGELFSQINPKDVEQVVLDCAMLQVKTLRRINVASNRKAFAVVKAEFDADVAEIIKRINAAMPDDVRMILKKAANA